MFKNNHNKFHVQSFKVSFPYNFFSIKSTNRSFYTKYVEKYLLLFFGRQLRSKEYKNTAGMEQQAN
jgi:hypothetical protein